jgi:pectin methylesterase-like acyl-CoA thioesterase/acetyl esterase/lipase
MRQLFYILTGCLVISRAGAQPAFPPTGKPDTSYTISSAYESTKKNYPGVQVVSLHNSPLVKMEKNIVYATTGSRKLHIDVFSPARKKTGLRTAVIIIHGGGWRSGNKSLHHPMAERLAERGYVCFTPEYRLSPEALFPAAVMDIKAAISWVRNKSSLYGLDPGRIVIAGHSAGGELAAFAGTTNGLLEFQDKNTSAASTKVNAVIDLDGLLAFIHPESGEGDDSKRLSAATQFFGDAKTANPGLWKKGSPLTHINQSTPPTLFINSTAERMHAGRDDFIKLASHYGVFTDVKVFNAPHLFVLFEPWFTPVVNSMDTFLQEIFPSDGATVSAPPTIIVAPDGSGQYTKVQDALDAVPRDDRPVTIYIKNGIYKEKLFLDSLKAPVTMIGEDRFNTVLSFDDHTGRVIAPGDTINTRTSWSFKILSDDFTAKNISFVNDAGFTAGQAVAVESDGDRARFYDCRFIGNQDVLFINNDNGRQYFKDCYIEGSTDFIFGSATAWFEQCRIHSKKNSHITAASTAKEKEFGYIFNDCVLTGDTSLHSVSLGRPWRPYAQVIYMNTYIGPHIRAEGWSNWNNTENYLTARYAEYKNYGPGATISGRVKWSKQLTAAEAKSITPERVFNWWYPDRAQ